MNFITKHILEITILCYLFLFCAGMSGWFTNGMGWTKFDLGFIWQGVTTLFGPGVFGSIKYLADSGLNSEKGANPYVRNVERRDKDEDSN